MNARERARRIRRYAVTATVTLFIAIWSAVYTEMRAGNDPALGSGTPVAASTQTTTPSAGSSDDRSDSSSSSPTPSAVTTQQS